MTLAKDFIAATTMTAPASPSSAITAREAPNGLAVTNQRISSLPSGAVTPEPQQPRNGPRGGCG